MNKQYPILLEYSEEQKCIHYNFKDADGVPVDKPCSNGYYTIAETTTDEASRFLDDINFNNLADPSIAWLKQAWTDWKKYN